MFVQSLFCLGFPNQKNKLKVSFVGGFGFCVFFSGQDVGLEKE